jgi:ABC-2 type transport system ATP-binding protein
MKQEGSMNIIEVEGLSKTFGKSRVLNNISMSIKQGDIYGFLGPNGSGKTTTLRIIIGLLQPDEGSIRVMGKEISSWSTRLRNRVNVLPESHGFYGWMDAVTYLRFFGNLYGVMKNREDYRTKLREVGLDPENRQPIKTFSRGMKQRLGIARSIINSPEILFLDEPTNGLDPQGRREIHDLLVRLNQENATTIIVSTHILDDVERLCNRIAILQRGSIRFEGDLERTALGRSYRYKFRFEKGWNLPDHWRNDHIEPLTKTGNEVVCQIDGITATEAIGKLIEAGMPIVGAEEVTSGIEDIYFAYTEGEGK